MGKKKMNLELHPNNPGRREEVGAEGGKEAGRVRRKGACPTRRRKKTEAGFPLQ